jgi:hypothetical protein
MLESVCTSSYSHALPQTKGALAGNSYGEQILCVLCSLLRHRPCLVKGTSTLDLHNLVHFKTSLI